MCVTDATNLRQNLRLVLSLKRLGLPMVVALNMSDIARRKGIAIDAVRLRQELGVPVVETVGVKASGAGALIDVLNSTALPVSRRPATVWRTPTAADIENDHIEVRRTGEARNQFVALSPPDGRVSVRACLRGLLAHLSRCERAHELMLETTCDARGRMNRILDDTLVGLALLASAGYARRAAVPHGAVSHNGSRSATEIPMPIPPCV